MFEAGSTSEMTVKLRVVPDGVFETNETYVLTLFVPRSVRQRQSLMIPEDVPVITIINDDSKLYILFVYSSTLYLLSVYLTVIVFYRCYGKFAITS